MFGAVDGTLQSPALFLISGSNGRCKAALLLAHWLISDAKFAVFKIAIRPQVCEDFSHWEITLLFNGSVLSSSMLANKGDTWENEERWGKSRLISKPAMPTYLGKGFLSQELVFVLNPWNQLFTRFVQLLWYMIKPRGHAEPVSKSYMCKLFHKPLSDIRDQPLLVTAVSIMSNMSDEAYRTAVETDWFAAKTYVLCSIISIPVSPFGYMPSRCSYMIVTHPVVVDVDPLQSILKLHDNAVLHINKPIDCDTLTSDSGSNNVWLMRRGKRS